MTLHYNIERDSLPDIISHIETELEKHHADFGTIKRICTIAIELVQNTLHHSAPGNRGFSPTLSLKKENKNYFITASNLISPEYSGLKIPKEKLDWLNSASTEELEEHYHFRLRNGNLKDERAGLGLLSIKRISGSPLSYTLAPVDGDICLLTISLCVV